MRGRKPQPMRILGVKLPRDLSRGDMRLSHAVPIQLFGWRGVRPRSAFASGIASGKQHAAVAANATTRPTCPAAATSGTRRPSSDERR